MEVVLNLTAWAASCQSNIYITSTYASDVCWVVGGVPSFQRSHSHSGAARDGQDKQLYLGGQVRGATLEVLCALGTGFPWVPVGPAYRI